MFLQERPTPVTLRWITVYISACKLCCGVWPAKKSRLLGFNDGVPGTTELYYGPSFLDRSFGEPVNLVVQVNLGLVDFHCRQLPRGGAEHLGALFYALDEEEVEAGFPFHVEDSSVAPHCPVLKRQAENAAAVDSACAGSRQES